MTTKNGGKMRIKFKKKEKIQEISQQNEWNEDREER